jgi:cytosine/adenosine deaminase-related metal-dependent hydrolase
MQRGHWSANELLTAATIDGHASLGFDDAGRIAVGQRADLVTLDMESPRTAGTGTSGESVVFAATSQDVRQVMVEGRVVYDGDAETVGRALAAAIGAVS